MKGAIAAGHPLTAETGAAVLESGGNAVDACIAAAFAAAVAEGPLTGPAGGGFLLVHSAEGETTLLDCFFAVPARRTEEMEEVVIDFDDAGTQTFHVGEASVAVPGLVAGLAEAHRRFGSLPWASLVEPAIALAEGGVERDAPRDFLHRILSGILLRTEEGARVYGDPSRVVTKEIVPTLERIRDAGASAVADLLPELADDLAVYRVLECTPLRAHVLEYELLTTPTPSKGGSIVLDVLAALAALQQWTLDGEASAVGSAYGRSAAGTLTGTTHISVVDGAGAAASLSSTLGSGSGVFRGGTQLNNMLGELDVIGSEERSPGSRLPSMMTPTLALDAGEPRLVVGSAGSRLPCRLGDRGAPAARGRVAAPPRRGLGGRGSVGASTVPGRRPLGRPQSLLRWRLRGRAKAGRHARRRRRPSARRRGVGCRMIRVRRADPADAEALVALAERVGREEGRWILTTSSWRSAADERRYLKAVQHHADAAVFVVEDDGSVVGRLSLARDPHPASEHVADLGLMVAAGHRRRGLGKALLEEAVRWARDSGIRKLELHVFPWNDPALRLYEAFGFEREGLRREHYARDGEYVDAILMAYRIPGHG